MKPDEMEPTESVQVVEEKTDEEQLDPEQAHEILAEVIEAAAQKLDAEVVDEPAPEEVSKSSEQPEEAVDESSIQGDEKADESVVKQESLDIPTSSSFSKGDNSLASPSSTTEGAISPSIEEKSKSSEIVLDPCTLAQGFEDLAQKGIKVVEGKKAKGLHEAQSPTDDTVERPKEVEGQESVETKEGM